MTRGAASSGRGGTRASGPILPGATLGMLGGGQLGRMFALAARALGYRVHVFAPDADGPTAQVADHHVRAPYDDLDAVGRFARDVAVVSYEFENVPADTAAALERSAPVRPSAEFLHVVQDRLREKHALSSRGIPVAPHVALRDEADLAAAAALGFPAILKTASWGYDGKGQRRVETAGDLPAAWDELGRAPAVLEAVVPFVAELSVVGARGLDGSVALYDAVRNEHARHILDVTTSPAGFEAAVERNAEELCRRVLEELDVVGVACVELFLLPDGDLVVNEIAPRPHNSGHLTIDAHATSQFEQQVRAITGLPLGSTERLAPHAVMVNLLGDLWEGGEPDWAAALADPGVALHLYGKREARVGRKMGHLTVLDPDSARARERALAARERLTRTHATTS